MSRVWVVSGVVLVGTGVSLAAFGSWLIGNANCDATDLGRTCVSASLACAVVGLAMTVGGWLRVRRLGITDEGARQESAGPLPVAVVFAIAIVGILLVPVLNPAPTPPVDVFGRAAPAQDALPQEFLPFGLAGNALQFATVANGERNHSVVGFGEYSNGLTVRITRFNVSTPAVNTTGNGTDDTAVITVDEARQAARDYFDFLFVDLDRSQGRAVCGSPAGSRWYEQSGGSASVLAWQRENFVVQVAAPSDGLRDAAAAALAV